MWLSGSVAQCLTTCSAHLGWILLAELWLLQLLDNAGAKIEPGDKQVQLENLYISIKSLLHEKRRAICKLHELHSQMDLAVHDMAPVNMPSPTNVGKISGERPRRWSEKSPDRKATTIKDFDIVKPISHGAYGAAPSHRSSCN